MDQKKMSKSKIVVKDVEMKDLEVKSDNKVVEDPRLKSRIPTRNNNKGLGATISKEAQASSSSK